MTNKPSAISFLMWFLPLSFFTYQFILRLFPGLIMSDILTKFNIESTEYGIIASAYYYGYAGFQIPCAILLDTYKPKFVLFWFIIIFAIGTYLFSYTDNFYVLVFSRFLIGLGSAAGFLGVSKIISIWFSKDSYSKMIGLSFTIGLCGAVYGGKPTNLLIEKFGWQQVSLILSVLALVISILILLFLKSPTINHNSEEAVKPTINDAKAILSNPIIWLLGIASLFMVGPLEGFADVWGVNYLMVGYNFNKNTSAELVSYVFVGMLFGGPLIALLAKKYGDYVILFLCGILMSVIFIIMFYAMPVLNYYSLATLFIILGVLGCYQVLIFSVGASLNNVSVLGIRIAFLNCINMLGGSFFHVIIGKVMNNPNYIVTNSDNVITYSLNGYHMALSIIPICAFIGSLIIYLVKYKINK